MLESEQLNNSIFNKRKKSMPEFDIEDK